MAPVQSEDEGGPHNEKGKRRETKKLREMTRVVALQMDNFKRKLQLHQSKKKVQGRLTQSVQRLRSRRKHLQRHGRAEHISTQEVMKVSSLSAARSSDEFVSMVTPRRRRSATSLFKRAFTKTPNLALKMSPVKRNPHKLHLHKRDHASTGSDSDDVISKQVLPSTSSSMDLNNEQHKLRLIKLHVRFLTGNDVRCFKTSQ